MLSHSALSYMAGTYGVGVTQGAVAVSGLLEWVGFYVVMLGSAIQAVSASRQAVLIEVFIRLILLPVAFIFSVRFFPLYLGLGRPVWPVQQMAYVSLFGVGLQIVTVIPLIQRLLSGMWVISRFG